MDKKTDIVCVGGGTVDIIARTIDEWPAKGSIHLIDEAEQHTGGCALNTAAVLGTLGVNVGIAGVLGDDPNGTYILDRMKSFGIRTSDIRIIPEVPSAYTFACVHPDGERSFFHFPGAGDDLRVEDIHLDTVGEILHIAGGPLFSRLDGNGLAGVLKRARSRGICTTYDPVLCERTGNHEDLLGPCYEHLSVFMPSLDEARLISGLTEPEDMARHFLDRGAGRIVIKLGGEGSYCLDSGGVYRCPPFRVAAVDTTGAGDSFTGGYLFGMLNGFEPGECLKWGNAAGALCVQKPGANANVMDEEGMRRWMDEHPLPAAP